MKPLITSLAVNHGLSFFSSAMTEGVFVGVAEKHSDAAFLDSKKFI